MLANKQPPRRDYAEEVLPPLRLSPRAPSHVSSTPASRLKGPEGSRSALPSFAFPYNHPAWSSTLKKQPLQTKQGRSS